MKFDVKTLLVIAVAGILVIQFAGIYDFTQFLPDTTTPPAPTATPTGQQIIDTTHTANAKWKIRDALTRTATESGDTGYVSVVRADANGYFDLLNPVEETEFDASPDTSSGIYATGDELLFAISSDNDPTTGDETYPRWFAIQSLDAGAQVKAFPLDNPISALTEYSSGGSYKYKVNYNVLETTGQSVSWLEGATPYWIFGDNFDVYGRVDNAGIVQSITNKGSVGTSVADGSTWDDTSTEVNANFTLAADSEDFFFEIVGEAADVAWGIPTLAVSSAGQVVQYNAVLVVAFNGVSMATQSMIEDGWVPFTMTGVTSNITLYYPITNPSAKGFVPSTGSVINAKIPFTVSDTGLVASTEYNYAGWMLDWQNIENVQRGAFATSLPTVYGFLTEYGSDTVIQAKAPTISSGRTETPQLYGYFTTNA